MITHSERTLIIKDGIAITAIRVIADGRESELKRPSIAEASAAAEEAAEALLDEGEDLFLPVNGDIAQAVTVDSRYLEFAWIVI